VPVPGSVTLSELRSTIRQRADMVSMQFVTDSELNGYINASYRELRDLLVQVYGEDYFATSYSFTTDGSSDTYALPDDFFKLLGVDLLVSGSDYISLTPFNFNERNRFSGVGASAFGDRTSLRYRLRASTLWLAPRASSGQTVRLLYVPRATTLSDSGGGMDAIGNGVITFSGVTAGDTITGNKYENGVPAAFSLVAGTDFAVGADDAETAQNFADLFAASETLAAAASGASVYIDIDSTDASVLKYTWATTAASITIGDAGATSALDGVQGWEEYVVVDCVIKCKLKEESDVAAEMALKAALVQRIEAAAANRDAGEAATVADVYATRATEWGY
jgi:hypothetical protein